jgi:uncharacterized protein (DUF4415 family)
MKRHAAKKVASKILSRRQKAEIGVLGSMPDEAIDTSDIPEVTDWSGAWRGVFYRPIKQQLMLRLDADVVACFKRKGGGYQTRINRAPREYAGRAQRQARGK